MEHLTNYQYWQLKKYGNYLPDIIDMVPHDEDDIRQDIPDMVKAPECQ